MQLYRQGRLQEAKRCFENHKAAYTCYDCETMLSKINEEQLKQSAYQAGELVGAAWCTFAEAADHFTMYIGYIQSEDLGQRGLEFQVSPVWDVVYWGINITLLEKRMYNFPLMYNDWENKIFYGFGTSAGLHSHLFSVKRKKENKTRRLFSIEGRVGYGVYFGGLGTEFSFEYFPEAYVSLNNFIGVGAKYISSIDGWANSDYYLGNPTFLDNMGNNNYFHGLRYTLFINLGDIF